MLRVGLLGRLGRVLVSQQCRSEVVCNSTNDSQIHRLLDNHCLNHQPSWSHTLTKTKPIFGRPLWHLPWKWSGSVVTIPGLHGTIWPTLIYLALWCSPDGVAPSRMVNVSASVNLSLHHKVQKFSSGTGSPGCSRKKGHKTVVVWCCGCDVIRIHWHMDSNGGISVDGNWLCEWVSRYEGVISVY